MKRTFKPSELNVDRKKFDGYLARVGLTQNQLAKKAGFEQKQTLSKILTGNRRLMIDEFVALVRVLGVSPAELLRTFGFNTLSRQAKVTAGLTAEGIIENFSSRQGATVDLPVNTGEIGEIVFIDIRQGNKSYLFGSHIFTEPWRAAGLADANRLTLIEVPKIGERILGTIFPLRAGEIMIRNIITDEEISTSGSVQIAPVIDWRFS